MPRENGQDAMELAGMEWLVMPLHTWTVDRCDCRKQDCTSPAKHPRTQHGLDDATTDLAQIAKWWQFWPAANIGVATGPDSGIVVVDIDPRHGGTESWVNLREEHGYEHEGPACLTGGGGLHLYFQHPGTKIRNSSGEVAEGIDIKGDRGYVVAPPSVHAAGTSYSWIEGYAPWERALPPIPGWLLELMRKAPEAAGLGAAPIADRIRQGQRRNVLLSLAGSMRHRNMGEQAIFNALMAENAEKCDPPLETQEVAKIAAAAGSWEPGAAFILPSTKPNKDKAQQRTPEPFTLAELETEEIEPVRWAVPGLLPEGLAIVAGKAKLGKSWLALGLLIAVGFGEEAFEYFPTLTGDGLYLALEDTKRRLKNRTKTLLPGGGWPARIWCEVQWPGADDGGLEAVEAWLGQHPEARVVVIDTFAKFKPQTGGKRADVYAEDYAAVSAVKQVADRYGVAIVLITHLNKGEHEDWVNNITGSTGISGSADTLINLDRPRKEAGQGEAMLLLTGRDVEEKTWGCQLAGGKWKITGDLEEVQRAKEYDETRLRMREMWLDGVREVTASNFGKFTGKRLNTCQQALVRAYREGFIDRLRQGTYMLKPEDQPDTSLSVSTDQYAPPRRLRLVDETDKTDRSDWSVDEISNLGDEENGKS